jgi:hypothetical protein
VLSLPVVRPVRVGLGVIRAGPNPLHFVAGVLLNLGFLILEQTVWKQIPAGPVRRSFSRVVPASGSRFSEARSEPSCD